MHSKARGASPTSGREPRRRIGRTAQERNIPGQKIRFTERGGFASVFVVGVVVVVGALRGDAGGAHRLHLLGAERLSLRRLPQPLGLLLRRGLLCARRITVTRESTRGHWDFNFRTW